MCYECLCTKFSGLWTALWVRVTSDTSRSGTSAATDPGLLEQRYLVHLIPATIWCGHSVAAPNVNQTGHCSQTGLPKQRPSAPKHTQSRLQQSRQTPTAASTQRTQGSENRHACFLQSTCRLFLRPVRQTPSHDTERWHLGQRITCFLITKSQCGHL